MTVAPLWRKASAGGKILEKGLARYEIDSDGRTGLQEMIARGWRTASPHFGSGDRLVTNSACLFPMEASSRVSERLYVERAGPGIGRGLSAAWTQPVLGCSVLGRSIPVGLTTPGLVLPASARTASALHLLSAPSGNDA